MIKPLILYILQCARRDKIFLVVAICSIITFVVSLFLGSTAAYEKAQMSIVYASGAFRLVFVYGFIIFNAFFITKMIQNREIETLLAGPIPRYKLILSIVFANAILIFTLSLMAGIILQLSFWSIIPHFHMLMWSISLFLEVMISTTITIFFSIMLAHAMVSVLFATILYIISRSIGFIISAITVGVQNFSFIGIVKTITIPLSVFFPRLDLMSQSTWLIYSEPIQNLWLIMLQPVVYISLTILACIVDFNKKSL
ncbi:MAG: hypothetical protein ACI9CD_000326 [Candidatus Deianiraeaceae bacterium]|jgi:hypothetical protein